MAALDRTVAEGRRAHKVAAGKAIFMMTLVVVLELSILCVMKGKIELDENKHKES
jgi:hypothetical protein